MTGFDSSAEVRPLATRVYEWKRYERAQSQRRNAGL